MNDDAATRTWLKDELTSALGFAEVDDIAAYVLTSFSTKQEVTGYLTELLGISPKRADTITSRLFAAAPVPQKNGKPKGKSSGKAAASSNGKLAASANTSNAAVGLVPQAAMPNSRIKAAKPRKTGTPKMLHTRIINCLRCGKIEHNSGRKCTFCGTELRYEELDDDEIDNAATQQQQVEPFVLNDDTSSERTTVVDDADSANKQVGEDAITGGDSLPNEVVALDQDFYSRPNGDANRIPFNNLLTKEARDLCDRIARRLEKPVHRKSGTRASSQRAQ